MKRIDNGPFNRPFNGSKQNFNSLKRQAESKSFKSTREDKGKPALFIDTQGNQVMVDKMQLNIIRTIREEERSKTTP